MDERRPAVAPERMVVPTSAGVALGETSRTRAATPATCGAAIDVPLFTDVAELLAIPALRMLEPGAKRSMHVPQFENEERASVEVVEPTVNAWGVLAGDWVQASASSLPAETA